MTEVRSVLVVDLASGTSRVDSTETTGLLGLGEKALRVRILEKYLDPDVDPLGPGNVAAFTSSCMAEYGMSGSNRFAAFTKSPLTGIWLECYCGGSFARAPCGTGWGAVVVTVLHPLLFTYMSMIGGRSYCLPHIYGARIRLWSKRRFYPSWIGGQRCSASE